MMDYSLLLFEIVPIKIVVTPYFSAIHIMPPCVLVRRLLCMAGSLLVILQVYLIYGKGLCPVHVVYFKVMMCLQAYRKRTDRTTDQSPFEGDNDAERP